MSPFATMFSTLLKNYTFIYRRFLYFCRDVFKVVCCGLDACGKGLIMARNAGLPVVSGEKGKDSRKKHCWDKSLLLRTGS